MMRWNYRTVQWLSILSFVLAVLISSQEKKGVNS